MATGAVYYPPSMGLPFVGVVFAGGEIVASEAALTFATAQSWVDDVVAGIAADGTLEDDGEG